jgi:hypothetical protein
MFLGVELAVLALSYSAVNVYSAELGRAGVLSMPYTEACLPRF